MTRQVLPVKAERAGSPNHLEVEVAQVDHVPPAEPLGEQPGDQRLGLGVVAAHEHRMVAVGELAGFTMSRAFMVLRVLTTRTVGKARWMRSPSESVLATNREGGMPCE